MLIRIKNASMARKPSVVIPHSKLKEEIANILYKQGLIASVEKKGKRIKKYIELGLLYVDAKPGDTGKPKIGEVERISKPSRRVYQGFKDIVPAKHGYGVSYLSTPKGILIDRDAKKQKVGGEVLFKIY